MYTTTSGAMKNAFGGLLSKYRHYTHTWIHETPKVLQKVMFWSPFVIVPTFVGEVEQDWLYWPLKFRHVAEEWLTGTEWGRLFQQYQEQGCLTVRSAA